MAEKLNRFTMLDADSLYLIMEALESRLVSPRVMYNRSLDGDGLHRLVYLKLDDPLEPQVENAEVRLLYEEVRVQWLRHQELGKRQDKIIAASKRGDLEEEDEDG